MLSLSPLLCTPAAAQSPKPLAEAAEAQFARCVSSPPPEQARRRDDGVAAPAGLARGDAVTLSEVPTDRGKLYAYRDHGGREIVCGVAIYGVDPGPLAERLVAAVHASPLGLRDDPKPHYALSGAKPGRVRYFGAANGPGLEGVLIIERPASEDAPSLEADFHVILLQ
jgi:hypothetical protein